MYKRSSKLQRWRCSCKLKSRRIGSKFRETGKCFDESALWKVPQGLPIEATSSKVKKEETT
jgi:hypothetical protein